MYKETAEDQFCNLLLKELPGIRKNPSVYFKVVSVLLCPPRRDVPTGLPLVSQTILAWCAGAEDQLEARRFVAERVLEDFARDVDPSLDWIEWVPNSRYRVAKWNPPPAILAALDRENRADYPEKNRVNLITGKPVSAMQTSRDLAQRRERAHKKTRTHPPGDKGQRILDYMNGLSARHYSSIRQRLPQAYVWVGTLSEEKQEIWWAYLGSLRDHLVPVWTSSKKSARLTALGVSIAGACSSLRRILCPDWVELDISNCVVACVAKEWGAKKVYKFLRQGKDFWRELCHVLGIYRDSVDFDHARRAIKKAIVSALFLSNRKTWQEELAQKLPSVQDPGGRVVAHPLVRDLMKARNRMKEKIRAAGGATMQSGKWVALQVKERYSKKKQKVVKVSNAASILAQLSHEKELEIIHAAYEFVFDHKACWILNYQFDGFSLGFRDMARAPRLTEMLIRHVQKKLDEMGIPTRLKIEYAPWIETRRPVVAVAESKPAVVVEETSPVPTLPVVAAPVDQESDEREEEMPANWFQQRGDGGILDDIGKLMSRKLYIGASGNKCLVPTFTSEEWEYLDRRRGYDAGDRFFEAMEKRTNAKSRKVIHDF